VRGFLVFSNPPEDHLRSRVRGGHRSEAVWNQALHNPLLRMSLDAQLLSYPARTASSMPASSSSLRKLKCDSRFLVERRPLFCKQSWMKRSIRRSGMSTIS